MLILCPQGDWIETDSCNDAAKNNPKEQFEKTDVKRIKRQLDDIDLISSIMFEDLKPKKKGNKNTKKKQMDEQSTTIEPQIESSITTPKLLDSNSDDEVSGYETQPTEEALENEASSSTPFIDINQFLFPRSDGLEDDLMENDITNSKETDGSQLEDSLLQPFNASKDGEQSEDPKDKIENEVNDSEKSAQVDIQIFNENQEVQSIFKILIRC